MLGEGIIERARKQRPRPASGCGARASASVPQERETYTLGMPAALQRREGQPQRSPRQVARALWISFRSVHFCISTVSTREAAPMRATVYKGPYSVEVVERPDPAVNAPTDAVVRVSLGCVCGSDLWYYRGESPHALGPIGHEFIGIVEDIGAEVRGLARGDLVVAPFTFSDGTCPHCRAGATSKCSSGGSFGNHGIDGGQGEAVRVPLAGSTLVRVGDARHSDATMRSLAALSDVCVRVTTPQ